MSTTIQPQPTDVKQSRPYQICTKTIMDTSDPLITFNQDGVCNHVEHYEREAAKYVLTGEAGKKMLNDTAERIRKHGRGRTYDCILGLSGGVDSTYLCLLAKELGLRPLVVHFDNGWNSELAVHNIENTVKKLGFDLYTYVVNWPEFRSLQRAYFKANVIDIEVLTDHGFMAVLYQQAKKHRLKFVLGGMNVVTESILPSSWVYSKADLVNIKAIYSAHGDKPTRKLRSFPLLSLERRMFLQKVLGLEILSPLNWIDFDYDRVKAEIISELGWREYGGKHFESIFTRFYQGHILPKKFGIDKRRAHFSTLICSGQMTRKQALHAISMPTINQKQLHSDLSFVLKKLGFSEAEFDKYLSTPRIDHRDYAYWKSPFQKYPWLGFVRTMMKSLQRKN